MPKLDGVVAKTVDVSPSESWLEPDVVEEQPKELLAISLRDVMAMQPEMRVSLLKDGDDARLDLSQTVAAGRDDDPAVVFSCSLLAAAVVCDVVRSQCREQGVAPAGVYLCRSSTWQRVRNDLALTVLEGESASLNPAVFDVKVEQAAVVAPPRKAVDF